MGAMLSLHPQEEVNLRSAALRTDLICCGPICPHWMLGWTITFCRLRLFWAGLRQPRTLNGEGCCNHLYMDNLEVLREDIFHGSFNPNAVVNMLDFRRVDQTFSESDFGVIERSSHATTKIGTLELTCWDDEKVWRNRGVLWAHFNWARWEREGKTRQLLTHKQSLHLVGNAAFSMRKGISPSNQLIGPKLEVLNCGRDHWRGS